MQLKQVGLVVQRKLHHVRPLADIARDKRRPGFGIETNDSRGLDLGCGGRKLCAACRHMDALQREADERFQQRDLGFGRGDFFHGAGYEFEGEGRAAKMP